MLWTRREAGWGAAGHARLWALGAMLLLGTGLPARAVQEQDPDQGMSFAGGSLVRGRVEGVAGGVLTIKTETGEMVKVVVTTNTRITKGQQPVKVAEIHVGDGVGAVGVMDEPRRTVHAVMVFVADAEEVKRAAADLGRTYITGRVTAIHDVRLTILRPDGVSQVIRVDEDTSFRKGRPGAGGEGTAMESVTLGDVKVGDGVLGKGGLKDGVFVPTELAVLARGQDGWRQRGAAEGSAMRGGGGSR